MKGYLIFNRFQCFIRRNGISIGLAGAASIALMACSGGSDNAEPMPSAPESVPQINPPQTFSGALSQKGETSVARFIKNGLYSQSVNAAVLTPESPTSADNNGRVDGQFSTTNTQEAGVDEADRIEFDGEYFYTADFPVWLSDAQLDPVVRILALEPDNSLTEVNRLPVDRSASSIYGMYLSGADALSSDANTGKHLAIISGAEPIYPVDSISGSFFVPASGDLSFSVDIYDVSNPANIDVSGADKIDIDGRLISSRRIDDTLYIISTFQATVDGLDSNTADAETQLANYQKVMAIPNDALLPAVVLNGAEQTILSIDDCLIPEQASAADGSPQIIQITQIDLNNAQNMQAMCMSVVTSVTYTSSDALYLSGIVEDSTFLHKISLTGNDGSAGGGISYEASGLVPGIIGQSGQPQLRLSEDDGILRIVTSDYTSVPNDPLHRLFVLEQQDQALTVVGQLPNETYPDPIGKPREDVYAVRYVGSKAYVVTFERTDPLYVIDLSDPQLPAMQGALEIPGFSSYLQPFGSDLLLGVGQQINFGDIPDTGQTTPPTFTTQELKVSLFDVRDPMNPIELDSITKTESYTPVEFDYRALSVLKIGEVTTFGMPVETWAQDDVSLNSGSVNSLMIIDVDESSSRASLSERLLLTPPTSDRFYIFGGDDRSVITTNGIYYLRGNQVWFHSGVVGDAMLGPY